MIYTHLLISHGTCVDIMTRQIPLNSAYNDIKCKEKCRLGKIPESQMGSEPTTLRDLVGCSNHSATGDSMVSKGQFVGLDFSESTFLLTFNIIVVVSSFTK